MHRGTQKSFHENVIIQRQVCDKFLEPLDWKTVAKLKRVVYLCKNCGITKDEIGRDRMSLGKCKRELGIILDEYGNKEEALLPCLYAAQEKCGY